ncbi:pre-peptidase C-terminal domain-containing protein [Oculatella sp. LEGE 06141]|uniref:pre-peptidase C-terminal domain-containing protein n=1 Tax=Oculatella sp. LEGE 06141 TaxID=1828648 RepID=UPI0018818D31|nr:pre-peptidase C-terminal domain-containing protein [Oculatella sp. LEGE 06141]MBE9177406.1 pre-peptidase C-terminal domain-containing protein [Oculatella sp. LEGE 06141]
MKLKNLHPKALSLVIVTTLISTSTLLSLLPTGANAQEGRQILQEEGRLEPAQSEYTFEGREGQTVTITMTSEDFDTVLSLIGPNDEEIAYNDDYGRTLNSTIVTTLPANGTYKVMARSFSGAGGAYTVAVRPATRYEQAYSRALQQLQDGNTAGAIAAYTEAIQVDPNQPIAYLERAEARYSEAYLSLINEGEEMSEEILTLTAEQLDPILADYRKAAELYEQSGEADTAQSIREQITYLQTPQ